MGRGAPAVADVRSRKLQLTLKLNPAFDVLQAAVALVANVSVTARTATGEEWRTVSDAQERLTRHLTLTGGVTRLMNAFFRGTRPRVQVDSAPRTVSNGGMTLADFHGFNGSLRWRHVGNYRLDGEDATIRASGLCDTS